MLAKFHLVFVIIFSLAAIVYVNIGFIFLLLALMPSVVAYFVDSHPKRNIYRTIRAANIAGLVPYVMPLATEKNPAAHMQVLAGNMDVWVTVYGCALGGVVLLVIFGYLNFFVMLLFGETRVATLIHSREDLLKEWGAQLKDDAL